MYKKIIVLLFLGVVLTSGCGSGSTEKAAPPPPDPTVTDSDSDGIVDARDPSPQASALSEDADGDGTVDGSDPDADLDGDGTPNQSDSDADGDGIADVSQVAELLAGTYDSSRTVTEQTCTMGEAEGTTTAETFTIVQSADGQSLTFEGTDLTLTGWRLGNRFTLTGTVTYETSIPDCTLSASIVETGNVEGGVLTATLTSSQSSTPSGCAGSDCRTASSVEGTRK